MTAVHPGDTAWAAAPARREGSGRFVRRAVWTLSSFFCMAPAVLLRTIASDGAGAAVGLLALTGASSIALALGRDGPPPRWRWTAAAVAAAAGLAAVTVDDPVTAVALLLGVTSALAVVGVPVGGATVDDVAPMAAPVVLGSLVAGQLAWWIDSPAPSLLAQCVTLGVAGLVRSQDRARTAALRAGRPVVGFVETLVVVVGALLGAVLFFLLGIFVVVVPWALHRLVGWNPLWSPQLPRSSWVDRRRRRFDRARPWEADGGRDLDTRGRRLHRLARIATTCVIVAGLLTYVGVRELRRAVIAGPEVLAAPAMVDAAYWPDLSHAQAIASSRSDLRAYDRTVLPEWFRSTYLNIRDGRRVSWTPPSSSCPTTTIWMFGGSTTFGYGQRDEHTIASELARVAWEDGRRLDVANWGVPGDIHWVEARRLDQLLLTGSARPDMVLFYDGVNEYGVQALLAGGGRGRKPVFAGFEDSGLYAGLKDAQVVVEALLLPTAGEDAPRPRYPASTHDEVADATIRQYRLSVEMSRRIVVQNGLDAVWFFQPSLYTRDEPAPGERPVDPGTVGAIEQVAAGIPPGVVDLSGAMDVSPATVYYDDIHTNELGARLVAEAMYASLEPRLGTRCAP